MKPIALKTFLLFKASQIGLSYGGIFSRYKKGAFKERVEYVNKRVALVYVDDALADSLNPTVAPKAIVSKRDQNRATVHFCDCGKPAIKGDKFRRCWRCMNMENPDREIVNHDPNAKYVGWYLKYSA